MQWFCLYHSADGVTNRYPILPNEPMSVRFVQSSSSTCLRLNGGKHQSIEAALVDDDGSGLVGTPLNQGSALVLVIHMYRNSILWFLISQRRCDVLTYEEGLEPVP